MFEGRVTRVLVVDDNLLNRKKLSMAVSNLGHEVETVDDGATALKAMRDGGYDTVLLDLLMPEMDGFAVLDQLKSDAALRDLPVIVVSDLEGDTNAVTRAIELGAEDFLPKRFDPAILNARLNACLRKKNFRDQELAYFQRIDKLTQAAAKVEAGRFDDDSLGLQLEARMSDPIGRLALVFQGMASEIHAREAKLLHRIQTLQCVLLLLVCGGSAGLMPSLSRMSIQMGAKPIGMAVWVDLFAAVICIVLMMWRRRLPRLSRSDWAFFVAWAFVVGILQHLTIFVLAGHVEATFLTLVLALEGLLVFVFAAITRAEKVSLRRILGLLIGLAGVGFSLSQRMNGEGVEANFWLILALFAPLAFAFETIAVAAKRPEHVNPIAAVGIMFSISTVFALLLATATGTFISPAELASPLGPVIVGIACVTVVVNVTFFWLLKLGGGVFTSQKAYVTAVAGVLWGILLLNETMSLMAWLAIGLVLIGMYLVDSKASDEPITIKRDFNARRT